MIVDPWVTPDPTVIEAADSAGVPADGRGLNVVAKLHFQFPVEEVKPRPCPRLRTADAADVGVALDQFLAGEFRDQDLALLRRQMDVSPCNVGNDLRIPAVRTELYGVYGGRNGFLGIPPDTLRVRGRSSPAEMIEELVRRWYEYSMASFYRLPAKVSHAINDAVRAVGEHAVRETALVTSPPLRKVAADGHRRKLYVFVSTGFALRLLNFFGEGWWCGKSHTTRTPNLWLYDNYSACFQTAQDLNKSEAAARTVDLLRGRNARLFAGTFGADLGGHADRFLHFDQKAGSAPDFNPHPAPAE